MLAKEKTKTESTELQVFNVEKFSIAQLPELQGKKEEINSIIKLNPIVEIIDNSTYELAKKSRTAIKTLRTGLEKEQADVKRKIKTHILDIVDNEYDLLVLDVKKQETDRQTPITTYETELETKRQEKARLEQQRIDNIKKEIEDYVAQWKVAFNLMSFESIEKVSADFLESYTSYDLTILEEFEILFPAKIQELTQYHSDKKYSLTEAENLRLETARIKKEKEDLAKQKAEFEAKQKTIEIDNKKKQDELKARENKIAISKAELDAEKESIEVAETETHSDNIENKNLQEYPLTPKQSFTPTTFDTLQIEAKNTTENESQIPTVNVCVDLPQDVLEMGKYPYVVSSTQATPILSKTTWDDIGNDFKSSGEKSYFKWLKDNYNPPIKL